MFPCVILWISLPFFRGVSVSSVAASVMGRLAVSLSVSMAFLVGFCFLLSQFLHSAFLFGFLFCLVRCVCCGVHHSLNRLSSPRINSISAFSSGCSFASFCMSFSCWLVFVFCMWALCFNFVSFESVDSNGFCVSFLRLMLFCARGSFLPLRVCFP